MKLMLAAAAATLALSLVPAAAAAGNEQVIRAVFGHYGEQAVRVARCESTLRTWASNGQFLGLFQMGSWARARYGHGPDAWSQARAAYRYFAANGFSWRGAWACAWAA